MKGDPASARIALAIAEDQDPLAEVQRLATIVAAAWQGAPKVAPRPPTDLISPDVQIRRLEGALARAVGQLQRAAEGHKVDPDELARITETLGRSDFCPNCHQPLSATSCGPLHASRAFETGADLPPEQRA